MAQCLLSCVCVIMSPYCYTHFISKLTNGSSFTRACTIPMTYQTCWWQNITKFAQSFYFHFPSRFTFPGFCFTLRTIGFIYDFVIHVFCMMFFCCCIFKNELRITTVTFTCAHEHCLSQTILLFHVTLWGVIVIQFVSIQLQSRIMTQCFLSDRRSIASPYSYTHFFLIFTNWQSVTGTVTVTFALCTCCW